MKKPLALSAALTLAIGLVFAQGEPSPPPRDHTSFFSDGFETPFIPPPVCSIPPGFRVVERSWDDFWINTNKEGYPRSPSYPVPVGQFTERNRQNVGKPVSGKLYTTRFTADGGNHRITWVGAQPIGQVNYRLAQAAITGTVTISKCRADVYALCQTYDAFGRPEPVSSGNLYYGPNTADPVCRVTPGEEYWLTVYFHHPVTLDPTVNTCEPENPSDGTRCDINMSSPF